MGELTRRALLVAGAADAVGVLGLLAGCAKAPTSHPGRSGATSADASSGSPSPSAAAPRAADWAALAAALTGRLRQPGDSGYDQVRLTQNPAYDAARPLAVLTAAGPADVAAGLRFAANHGVPLAVRSGGHSYPGWSSGGAAGTGMPSSLVIDTRGMSKVAIGATGAATIGAGASLAQVYSAVGQSGRALAGGSCATVGIAGLTLGGGVGVLTRAYGLTCDALTELEIVTADGQVRTVSASREPDLFWACRGGGGGHLGVVTSMTFATTAAPAVTTFSLGWPAARATDVIAAWQDWAPGADQRLWSTLKLLGGSSHPAGPDLSVSGTWIGDPAQLDAQLAPLVGGAGAPANRYVHNRSYLDAMMGYADCAGIPAARCTTDPGGALTRESSANTSHVAYSALDSRGIADLIAGVQRAQTVPGLIEGGISLDALGGAVRNLASSDTAFVHRSALATVQYTSTFDPGSSPDAYFAYVRGFRSTMTSHWGNHAYVNYADATLSDPSTAYFGANATRLASVQAAYDPSRLFTQPQRF